MDLRGLVKGREQILRAKELALRGLLFYQPYIFSDDFETGVGYEIIKGEYKGLVYYQDIDEKRLENSFINRLIVNRDKENMDLIKREFSDSNQKLRVMYDYFIDEICEKVGDISKLSFADVGCNTGYFPLGFARRGAQEAVGYDRDNYSETYALLNEILGTNASFVNQSYDSKQNCIPNCKEYDVVTSVAVICHITDFLNHIAFLGSISKKALFIYTPTTDDDDYCIRFGEPNKYYKSDNFPYCFDNLVRPSAKLLRKSLELMGFSQVYELSNVEGGLPDSLYNYHKAMLAIR